MMETTAPILPAREFDETSEFYQKLGFRETGRWDEGYMIMVRDKVEVHFFLHPNLVPTSSHHMAYIRTEDVDGLSDEFTKIGLPDSGIPRVESAENKSWEMREMAVVDPNGTLLRIGQFM